MSRQTFITMLLSCVAFIASAAEPQATLDVTHFTPPAGWKSAEQAGARVYVSPDADPAAQAIIIVFASPRVEGTFDLRAAFDQMVQSTLQGRKLSDPAEVTASKTRQGYDALTQIITADDPKSGKLFAKMVAANVDNRFAGFCYAAANQSAYNKHADDFSGVLQSVSFAPAAAAAAASSASGAVKPPAAAGATVAADAWDFNELYASRAMSKERKAAYVKEMDQRRKPRVALGTVLGMDGKPVPNAKLQVRVWGTTNAGERTGFNLEVDDNGNFEQQVPDGLYKILAVCQVTYNGHLTPLPLQALDERPANQDYASIKGIVKDYRVAMYGLRPGEDPEKPFSYFGGALGVNDASTDLFNCLNTRYPKGTKIRLTLTPTGSLIDGSKGKSISYEFNVERLYLNSVGYGSIPIGTYAAKATATTPDGTTKALTLGRSMPDLHDSATVDWQGTGMDKEILDVPQLYIGG
jgi:hypothetical protein